MKKLTEEDTMMKVEIIEKKIESAQVKNKDNIVKKVTEVEIEIENKRE